MAESTTVSSSPSATNPLVQRVAAPPRPPRRGSAVASDTGTSRSGSVNGPESSSSPPTAATPTTATTTTAAAAVVAAASAAPATTTTGAGSEGGSGSGVGNASSGSGGGGEGGSSVVDVSSQGSSPPLPSSSSPPPPPPTTATATTAATTEIETTTATGAGEGAAGSPQTESSGSGSGSTTTTAPPAPDAQEQSAKPAPPQASSTPATDSASSGGSGGSGGSGSGAAATLPTRPYKKKDELTRDEAAIVIQKRVRGMIFRKRVKKLGVRLRNRTRSVFEILTTERTYVKALRALVEIYITPLRFAASTSPDPYLPNEEIGNIFSNIELILNTNSELLAKLESRLEDWNNYKTLVGDIIMRMAPFLKLYMQYCNNYDNAMARLAKFSQNDKFAQFLESARFHPDCNDLRLMDFLIMPIQRIPRYKLLLQETIKLTDETHPDYVNLTLALDSVSDIAKSVNESVKIMNQLHKIVEIQNSLTGVFPNLVEPARRFIKEGMLVKNKDKRWWFLFNDILVYAQKTGSTYKYKGIIPLNTTWVREVEETADKKDPLAHLSFLIVSTKKTYTVTADDEQTRDDWMKAIDDAVEVLVKKDPSLIEQRSAVGTLRTKEKKKVKEKDADDDADWLQKQRALFPLTIDLPRITLREFGNVDKRGSLHRKAETFSLWSSRTFLMKDGFVYLFKSASSTAEPVEVITTRGAMVKAAPEVARKFAFQILTGTRRAYISAKNEEEMDSWIAALESAAREPKFLAFDSVPLILANIVHGEAVAKRQAIEALAYHVTVPGHVEALEESKEVILTTVLKNLAAEDMDMVLAACNITRCLSENMVFQQELKKPTLDAVKGLTHLLGAPEPRLVEAAAYTLVSITCGLEAILQMENRFVSMDLDDTNILKSDELDESARLKMSSSSGPIPPLVTLLRTIPNVDTANGAAKALARLASNSFGRSSFLGAGALPVLVSALRSDNTTFQEKAARALGFLASNDKLRRIHIPAAGALPILVNLLTSPSTPVLKQVLFALKSLANDDHNREVLRDALALPKLISLLSLDDSAANVEIVVEAIECVRFFAVSDTGKEAILDAGGLPPLIQLLSSRSAAVQEGTLRALANLALKSQIVEAIRDLGGLTRLCELFSEPPSSSIFPHLTRVTANLIASDTINRQVFIDMDGVPHVIVLLNSSDAAVVAQAVKMVSSLATTPSGIQSILLASGVMPVLNLVTKGSTCKHETKKNVISTLKFFVDNHAMLSIIKASTKVPHLADFITGDDVEVREDARIVAEKLDMAEILELYQKTAPAAATSVWGGPSGVMTASGSAAVTLERVRAAFPYTAADETQIDLTVGDVIVLLERVDEAWWYGETTAGVEGYFPAHYTVFVE